MNEGIDIAFMGAKFVISNNKPAGITVHGVSAFYNIGQIARYGYLCAERQTAYINGVFVHDECLVRQYRKEQVKHTILA